MSVSSMLNSTVTRYQATPTQDATGGMIVSPLTAVPGFTNVPASIQGANGRVRDQYAQRQMVASNVIYTALDIEARPLDVLVEDSSGRMFKVLGYSEATAGHGLAYVAVVEEQAT